MTPRFPYDGSVISRRDWLGLMGTGLGGAAALLGRPAMSRAGDGEVSSGRIYAAIRGPERNLGFGIIAIDPETEAFSTVTDEWYFGSRVSPNGRMLAFIKYGSGQKPSLWVLDLLGGDQPRPILEDLSGRGHLCWSPDSKKIITSLIVEGDPWTAGKFETCRMNLDGTGREKLPIPETEWLVDWSPDDRWILSSSARTQPDDASRPPERRPIYVMHPDGRGERLLIEGDPRTDPMPDPRDEILTAFARFAPDGRRVSYVRGSSRGPDILSLWMVDIDGSNRRRLLAGKAEEYPISACWSPDGKWLAVALIAKDQDDDSGRAHEVALIKPDGSGHRKLHLPPLSFLLGIDWRPEPKG